MKLTNENYHSVEARKEYMGFSQFTSFKKCEKEALAMVNGELEEKPSDAFLFGGYVDAYMSGELNEFIKTHPEMFNSKTGELKSQFKNVDAVISAYENDELLKKYWGGEHQVIMTGEIEGVPCKIKIDSYHKDKCIVDGKVMRDFQPVWIEIKDELGRPRNVKVDFVRAYSYAYEAAFYQEIERQWNIAHGGEDRKLPFILDAITKEEFPDKLLIQIDQEYIDTAMEDIRANIKRYAAIKKGEIEPEGCGKCGTCRSSKKITGILSYKSLFHSNDFDEEDY